MVSDTSGILPYGLGYAETDYVTLTLVIIFVLGAFAILKLSFWIIRKKDNSIHVQFTERLAYVLITLVGLVFAFNSNGVTKTFLQGTAIITAIVGFAAQDSIKDIISGFLISSYRPFNTGDRIELESGIGGVVEELTLGHTILRDYAGLKIIVPNSRISSMYVKNYSVSPKVNSLHMTFPVSYNSDIRLTKDVIRQAIMESPYTIPYTQKDGSQLYSDTLFLEMADSALHFKTSVFYPANGPAASVVKDDITSRVWDALNQNGIEVPYNYMNVVIKEK